MPNVFILTVLLTVLVIFIINFKPPFYKYITAFIFINTLIVNLSSGSLEYFALYLAISSILIQFNMVIITAIQKKKQKELNKYNPDFKNTVADKNLTYEKTELLYFSLSALFLLLIGYILDYPLAFIMAFIVLSAAYYISVRFQSKKIAW